MKTLSQELEEMRVRINDWANSERDLVTAIGDALSNADNKLLDDVRNLSSEHEARRAAILKELKVLASRLGTFPALGADIFPALTDGTPSLPFQTPSKGQSANARNDRRGEGSLAEELTKTLAARPAHGNRSKA